MSEELIRQHLFSTEDTPVLESSHVKLRLLRNVFQCIVQLLRVDSILPCRSDVRLARLSQVEDDEDEE